MPGPGTGAACKSPTVTLPESLANANFSILVQGADGGFPSPPVPPIIHPCVRLTPPAPSYLVFKSEPGVVEVDEDAKLNFCI